MTYIKTQETLVKSLPQQERWMANYDGESWTISFEKLKMSTAHHELEKSWGTEHRQKQKNTMRERNITYACNVGV